MGRHPYVKKRVAGMVAKSMRYCVGTEPFCRAPHSSAAANNQQRLGHNLQ
jgi:hypothetical protein